jgi:hypothetical protein
MPEKSGCEAPPEAADAGAAATAPNAATITRFRLNFIRRLAGFASGDATPVQGNA